MIWVDAVFEVLAVGSGEIEGSKSSRERLVIVFGRMREHMKMGRIT